MLECYLNLNLLENQCSDHTPLNYTHSHEKQQEDDTLLALQTKHHDYINLQLDDDFNDIICYKKDPAESMVAGTVKWFHQVIGHPGEKRWTEILKQHYHYLTLCHHIEKLSAMIVKVQATRLWIWSLTQERSVWCTLGRSCHQCNWTRVVNVNDRQVQFNALTCIDTPFKLVEHIRIDD